MTDNGKSEARTQRIQQILEFIQKLAAGDLSARCPAALKGDQELEAVAVSLNVLAETLSKDYIACQITQKGLGLCLDHIVGLANLDFSRRLEPKTGHDSLDALMTGLNMLAEELSHSFGELRQGEERFKILADSTPDAVVLSDDGVICDVNANFERIFGYTPAEAKGMVATDFITAPYRGEIMQKIREKSEGSYSAVLQRKDGNEFPAELHAKLLPFEARQIRVTAIRDVTEQRRLEEKLRISDRMSSIGQLAAGIAHEINNPLAYVTTNIDLLAEKIDGLEKDISATARLAIGKMLGEIRNGVEAVAVIAKDMKNLSHVSDAEKLEEVDLHAALDSAIRMSSVQTNKTANIVRHYGEVPKIMANNGRLAQVFLNLLINAAQAMPKRNAGENQIAISTELDDAGSVTVEVKDNGSGMTAEAMKNLFTPFFTTKPAGVGIGLGLSLCHSIIASFGGRIQVQSEPSRGTAFKIFLKPAKPVFSDIPERKPVRPAIAGRILIIDDNEELADIMTSALTQEHDVAVANSARAALKKLESGGLFDLILCDLSLQDGSGADLYTGISRRWPGTEKNIVFVTGGAFDARSSEFLGRIPNPVLKKPFRAQELRDIVNISLQNRRKAG